jgi:hypothetical protein
MWQLTVNTIGSTRIGSDTVYLSLLLSQSLLTLSELLLLSQLPLFLDRLLPLDSSEKVMCFEIFGVIMAHTLLLHLPVLLLKELAIA